MGHQGNAKKEADRFGRTLIPCVDCASAAMLLVEDAPLCGNCIIKKTEDREPEWIVEHTRPLSPVKKMYG